MTIGTGDDPETGSLKGISHDSVSRWLEANIDGAVGPFRFEFITGGHSNLTFKVTAGDGRRLVLRRPPLGSVLATAHDMSREHRIISGVGRTTVPVPAALGLCEDETVNDAPFYIMDYVDGAVLHDAEIADAEIPDFEIREKLSASVVDVLADLHLADPDQIGLGDLGRKEAYLDRQLKRWKSQWEKSKTRELPAMEKAYDLLVKAKPDQRHTGVVHGDYRLGNMLIDPESGTISAVLDWELCTLGDVMADVGYILNNWVQPGEESLRGATAFPTMHGGFSTREELVEAYSRRTGFEVENANYYRAFQNWRLAAIVEGVLARYLKGVMADETVDTDQYRLQVENMADESLRLMATPI
ncbi:MAG: phosphotransferase family protein [Acidimicrobiales bacterium]